MILRSTTTRDAEAEKALLDWFAENFGAEDARDLADWVWGRERNAARYVDALAHIARCSKERGRDFVGNLLAHARRPAEEREAEEQLFETMRPHVDRARVRVLGHRGDPLVVEESLRELRVRLREVIRKMWPEKHRATVDGAIMSGSMVRGGAAVLDFRKIVQALTRHEDPLAVTARSSHGVTDDR